MGLQVQSPPRPDLRAYREATSLPFAELVERLSRLIGRKLIAYIASVKDVRAVDRWIAGAEPYKGAEQKLRLAYHIAKMLSDYEGQQVVQAWLTGLNPELHDRVPVRLLRSADPEEVGGELLAAARAFLAGG